MVIDLSSLNAVKKWDAERGYAVIDERADPDPSLKVETRSYLHDFYATQHDGLTFSWSDGNSDNYGSFSIMGYEQSSKAKIESIDEIANWLRDEGGDPMAYFRSCGRKVGLDLISQYRHWWPIMEEGNGDYLCVNERDGSIVWFQHDRFDGAKDPLKHVVLASSLQELLRRWSGRMFVPPKSLWWGSFRNRPNGMVTWVAEDFPLPP